MIRSLRYGIKCPYLPSEFKGTGQLFNIFALRLCASFLNIFFIKPVFTLPSHHLDQDYAHIKMWLKQRFRFNGYLDVKKIKVALLQVLQINQQFCGRTCDRKTNNVNYRINLLDLCWSKESSNWALVHNVFNVRSIIVNTRKTISHMKYRVGL